MRPSSAMITRMTHRLFGDFHADELLDGQRPAEVHVHAGQVIHAVGVGNPLRRREIFADLFGAAVQVADVRRDLVDDFAVGPQQQPQHAVRAGMLRTHVDQHFVGADVEFDDAWVFNLHAHGMASFASDAVVFQRELVILAQRMSDPVFGTEDAAQVGMPREMDAHQVERLALVPVGNRPHAGDGGTVRAASPALSSFQRGSFTLMTAVCLCA